MQSPAEYKANTKLACMGKVNFEGASAKRGLMAKFIFEVYRNRQIM